MNSHIHSVDSSYESKTSSSGSDSSQSSVNSEAIVARENVNTTINPNVSLQITNRLWGNEGSWPLERGRKRKINSGAMKAVGQPEPIDQAAESFSVSRTTLKRFCREPGTGPLPKHDERTLGVTDSKLSHKSESKQNLLQSSNGRVDLFGAVLLLVRIKRWSCSSKRHGCSGQWWSCGKHGYSPFKSDSIYQVVRLMLSVKRWRRRFLTKHAMQKNDYLVMSSKQIVASVVSNESDGTSNKPNRKRKWTVLPSCLVKIRENCEKTMENAVANLGVGISKLRGMCSTHGMQWWSSRKRLKSIQANVSISTSEEEPTSVFAASSEPLVTTNITHDGPTLVLHQQQTNLSVGLAQFNTITGEQFIENATASAVKQLTIKATYEENIVKFPFTLLDGLEKLKEMVATRFQLKPGSFKLKYEDKDGDKIWIACDTDLMGSVGDSKPPVNLTVLKLLVLCVAPESINVSINV